MDEGVSGFEERGSWREIVEHGRRVSDVLRELLRRDGTPLGPDFQDWEDWRPKIGESLDGEMAQKTSRQAAVDEGEGERQGKEPSEDIKSAGRELKDSVETARNGDVEDAADDVNSSIGHLRRALDSLGRRILRAIERFVYENLMTQVSPHYFDNDLVSANLQREHNGHEEETFLLEVDINDDDLKDQVSDRLDDDTEPAAERDGDGAPKLRSRSD